MSLEAAFVQLVAHCAQNMFHLTLMVSLRCMSLWRSLCGLEETVEEQRQRIAWNKKRGRTVCPKKKRGGDLGGSCARSGGFVSTDNEASAPRDSVVSETIKKLALETFTR